MGRLTYNTLSNRVHIRFTTHNTIPSASLIDESRIGDFRDLKVAVYHDGVLDKVATTLDKVKAIYSFKIQLSLSEYRLTPLDHNANTLASYWLEWHQRGWNKADLQIPIEELFKEKP